MTLVRIPTELTTAATDLVLAAFAVVAWFLLQRDGPKGLRGLLWRTVLLLLAVTALLGAVAHGLLPLTLVAFSAWGVFLIDPDEFLPFMIYEAAAMVLAMAGFLWLTWRRILPGAGWIAASIAVNIAAAAIQASPRQLDQLPATTASASISTSMPGSISRLTSTIVVAGMMSPNASLWARPTSSQRSISVTKIRVRTTSERFASAFSSTSAMISMQRTACA
jgi:hypothetical protein